MSDEKKLWTFAEMSQKVREDIDMLEEDPDEQFIKKSEMIGYFNEAIQEAEAEIMQLHEDYFLAWDYVPLVLGQSDYDLPVNVFAKKIRHVGYSNGSIVYPIKRIKNLNKFDRIAFAEVFTGTEDYQYHITNNSPGSTKMTLIPPARETATLAPLSPEFHPVKRWYIRNANRIPYIGDYVNPVDYLSTSVSATSNWLVVDAAEGYVTGDAVKLSVTGSNTVPGGLTADTTYYAV